ncbi:MAG: hypothetical protein ACAH11_14750, partial [Sphingomonas sp.]
MLALRRHRVIALLATIAVMAVFVTAILVSRPGPPRQTMPMMSYSAPDAAVVTPPSMAVAEAPPPAREMAAPGEP